MKTPTTLLALASLTVVTAGAPSTSKSDGSCGKCGTFPSGTIGGNAQIPLRTSADEKKGKAYKCTTFGREVRPSTCTNEICGLCMIFKWVARKAVRGCETDAIQGG